MKDETRVVSCRFFAQTNRLELSWLIVGQVREGYASVFVGSPSIALRDLHDFHRLNMEKYWWLSDESAHIHDLKIRRNEIIKKRSELQTSAFQNENYDDSSVS